MRCPVCASVRIEPLLSLEGMPVLGNLLWESREEAVNVARSSMDLCLCGACGHVFNGSFDPSLLEYSGSYENSLHFSPRFRAYARESAEKAVRNLGVSGRDIVEIGCGKGDFLATITGIAGGRGTGFDTSYAGAYDHRRDLTFVRDFYSEKYDGIEAGLVVCRQVLEHIPEPGPFVGHAAQALGNGKAGRLMFEVPNALNMFERLRYHDLIYEHCGYYTPASLEKLFTLGGFDVLEMEETYDGQYLVLHARKASGSTGEGIRAGNPEKVRGAAERFARSFGKTVEGWKRFIFTENAGKNIVLWGAGTKGIMFAFLAGLGNETIPFIVDLNRRKQGKYLTGAGQLIVPPDRLLSVRPDLVIVMNAIYEEEIKNELSELSIECETVTFDRLTDGGRIAD